MNDRLCAADTYAIEWLERHRALVGEPDIFRRLVESRVGSGLAWFFPHADVDRLTLIVEMVLWAMSLDRHSGEVAGAGDYRATARSARLAVEAFDRPDRAVGSADPFQRAAAGIAMRLRREVLGPSADRLLRALRDFVLAKRWEVNACAGGRLPAIEDYLPMRQHTVLAVIVGEFIEPAGRFLISDAARADRRVRRLAGAARNVVAWTNDLRSFQWERHEGAAPPASLPTLIARRDHVDHDRAVDTVADMLDEERRLARRLVAELLPAAGSELRSYLAGIDIFVDHTDDWHNGNPRYRLRCSASC